MRSTVEVAPRGPRPAIRLRPVPRYEPPFDDELSPQVWSSPRQLPLSWEDPPEPDTGQPERPAAPPVVAGASHDAKLAVRRFVHMCVEVLNGYRPAGHLRRLALPSEAAHVVAEGLAGARRVTEMRNARRPGTRRPLRPAPVAVLRLRLCEPRPGAVEAAVALVTGQRTWAMALRMELHQQSWSATVLRLI
ncbi:Rv3235 family protein [Actinoplanes sp. NPDC051861]|uniref:Rv3235 family protein n=1 Tax=Actinoplanes sp. NPDC051861 TaxID=3155170 RepID=UPI003449F0E5